MVSDKLIVEKKSQSESNKNYIYRMIFKNIIFCRLLPGEIISENTIADIFSVSRTPIRESIQKLVAEGLLEVYPQRGTYVSYINMNRIRESVFMRIVLEAEALKLACRTFRDDTIFLLKSNLDQQIFFYGKNDLIKVLELDNKFHCIVFEYNDLPNVWKALQSISSEQYRVRYLKLVDKWRWDETIREHQGLIQDIKDGNEEKATSDIRCHISKIYDDAKIVAEKHKEYFKCD